MKRILPAFLFVVLSMPFLVRGQTMYFPPTTGNGWETMDPAELGWCQDSIASLLDYLEQKQSKAFLVLKDGKMVIEHYFGSFTQDSIWYWASAGKSLTAFLVGQAIEDGYLSLTDQVSDHLGNAWTSCPPEKEQLITVRHQLTMTTGLDDGVSDNDCTDPSCLLYLSDAGTRWAYHNAPYTLTHAVVEAATGQTFNQFTNTSILQPIGMNGLWWNVNYNEVFFSTPRSMARFGLLMLNNGIWNGDTLMHDQEYFYDMVHPSQGLNRSYGYLWWLNGQDSFMLPSSQFVFPGSPTPSAPDDMFAALGKNGQMCSISPGQGLVVIRMGDSEGSDLISLELSEGIWSRLNHLSCPTGIVANSSHDGVALYPNPASGTIFLRGQLSQNTTATLSTIMGRSVKTVMIGPDHSIDINDLSAGAYILHLTGPERTMTLRFLKE